MQKRQNVQNCEANIFLEKVTNSVNSQANIKASGNDCLTAKIYKHYYLLMFVKNILSNHFYVYHFWENLVAMEVSSRIEVISSIYKKGDKEDITNYIPISLIFRCNNIYISKY